MALVKGENLPSDAVPLSEFEAIKYTWELISDWKPSSETWALRYSVGILGGISALSGTVIVTHFRNKVKLGAYGFMASAIPNSLLPGVFTAFFHRHLVSNDIVLMKKSCPICYEVRSAAIQCGLAIAYPLVLSPITCFMLANRFNTYRLPSLVSNPKELIKYAYKMGRSLSASLTYLAVINLVASSVLTHYEMKNNIAVRNRIIEIEKQVDNQ